MRYRTVIALMVAAASVGCTTTGVTPATAPSTTAPAAVSSTTAAVDEPTSSLASTTTAPPTSTPPPTTDRLAEIQAIFEDLERRRLEAIYTGDVEAFSSLFADTPYLEQSLPIVGSVAQGMPPDISIDVVEVLRDDETCLAIWSVALVDGEATDPVSTVLMPTQNGWGFALVSEEKGSWLCDGPHPLS